MLTTLVPSQVDLPYNLGPENALASCCLNYQNLTPILFYISDGALPGFITKGCLAFKCEVCGSQLLAKCFIADNGRPFITQEDSRIINILSIKKDAYRWHTLTCKEMDAASLAICYFYLQYNIFPVSMSTGYVLQFNKLEKDIQDILATELNKEENKFIKDNYFPFVIDLPTIKEIVPPAPSEDVGLQSTDDAVQDDPEQVSDIDTVVSEPTDVTLEEGFVEMDPTKTLVVTDTQPEDVGMKIESATPQVDETAFSKLEDDVIDLPTTPPTSEDDTNMTPNEDTPVGKFSIPIMYDKAPIPDPTPIQEETDNKELVEEVFTDTALDPDGIKVVGLHSASEGSFDDSKTIGIEGTDLVIKDTNGDTLVKVAFDGFFEFYTEVSIEATVPYSRLTSITKLNYHHNGDQSCEKKRFEAHLYDHIIYIGKIPTDTDIRQVIDMRNVFINGTYAKRAAVVIDYIALDIKLNIHSKWIPASN